MELWKGVIMDKALFPVSKVGRRFHAERKAGRREGIQGKIPFITEGCSEG